MNERAKQVGKLAYWKAFEYAERPDNGVLEIAQLIEQALLAERRLAMEAMEEAANELFGGTVGPSIRRAAEKQA